jgi:hypothetical protein
MAKDKLDHFLRGTQIWISLSQEERSKVKVGLYPFAQLREAHFEGFDQSLLMKQLDECASFQRK